MSEQQNTETDRLIPQILSPEDLASRLGTDLKSGLTTKTARFRLRQFGRNQIRNETAFRFSTCLKDQCKNLTYLFFLISTFILYLFDPQTVYLIAIFSFPVVILVSAFLEFYASTELNRLSQSASLSATVLRNGKEVTIDSRLLVPGDIIWITGNRIVPADCRIISDDGKLLVLETPVSGKKSAVRKSAYEAGSEDMVVCPNMLYAGTVLREGSCYALVCFTGAETLTRQIHKKKTDNLPLLLKQVRTYSRRFSSVAMILCFAVIVLSGLLRENIVSYFLLAAALSASSLSDSILSLSIASFSHHLLRMSDDNLIARNQDSISRLASVNSILCTKERMLPPSHISLASAVFDGTVISLDESPRQEVADLIKLCLACSDYPRAENAYDQAVVQLLKDFCIPMNDLQDEWFRIDTGRDMNDEVEAVLSLHADHYTTVIKGSPETVLARCVGFSIHGKDYRLSDASRKKLLSLAQTAARDNSYLIALASGYTSAETLRSPDSDRRLIFRGILAFRTSVEVDIAKAIYLCNTAGIESVVSTNDPYYTAVSTGKSTGIIRSEGQVISSRELDVIDYGMFVLNSEKYKLFLEPSRDQWKDVLRLRKQAGRSVALIGESPEDLSLLHDADISVVPLDSPDILRESSDFIMKESGLHVLADGITHAKALCHKLRWLRQFAAAGFLTILVAVLLPIVTKTAPVFQMQDILFGGIFANFAIAAVLAFSPVSRKILNYPTPAFKGGFAVSEILFPLLYALGAGGCLFGLFRITGSSTCTMLAFVLLQYLYACCCQWPESLFRGKQFGSRPLFILLPCLLAFFALLLLIPGLCSALCFVCPSWHQLLYTAAFPLAWHLLVQTLQTVLQHRNKRNNK